MGHGKLPDLVESSDPGVERGSGTVSRRPQCFPIKWYHATRIVLFLSVVDNWRSIRQDGESDRVLGQ